MLGTGKVLNWVVSIATIALMAGFSWHSTLGRSDWISRSTCSYCCTSKSPSPSWERMVASTLRDVDLARDVTVPAFEDVILLRWAEAASLRIRLRVPFAVRWFPDIRIFDAALGWAVTTDRVNANSEHTGLLSFWPPWMNREKFLEHCESPVKS